ncbi:MAG: LysR substrate-binding domain-containing protein, partial [Oscillospiraceae bacterium]
YSPDNVRHRFSVSTQHYSFVVKAFADTVRRYDAMNFDFSVRETTTMDVIRSVAGMKSDIGILFMSSLNRRYLSRLLAENELEFTKLISCKPCVYLSEGHPLAHQESISFSELGSFPCLSFEQEEDGAFFLSEEILADKDYPRVIRCTDRATMLNLMGAINGYTLCSGIICEEINGSGYRAVPFREDNGEPQTVMELGFIVKSGIPLDGVVGEFVEELKTCLKIQ